LDGHLPKRHRNLLAGFLWPNLRELGIRITDGTHRALCDVGKPALIGTDEWIYKPEVREGVYIIPKNLPKIPQRKREEESRFRESVCERC
jgi:hypothetical protein